MDSNPEEFQGFLPIGILGFNPNYSKRWAEFLSCVQKNECGLFTDEERGALLDKLRSVQGDTFTNAVMRELTK
jgi:hypothetical protein